VAGDAVAQPEVEVVERAGADAHQGLSRTRNRIGELPPLEGVRAAVALHAETEHRTSL
jgi:hypothetical protein